MGNGPGTNSEGIAQCQAEVRPLQLFAPHLLDAAQVTPNVPRNMPQMPTLWEHRGDLHTHGVELPGVESGLGTGTATHFQDNGHSHAGGSFIVSTGDNKKIENK